MYSTLESFRSTLKSAAADIAADAFELEGHLPDEIAAEIPDGAWHTNDDGSRSIEASGLERVFSDLIDSNEEYEMDLLCMFEGFARAIDEQRQAEAEAESDDEDVDA